MKLILSVVLIGHFIGTSYRSVPNQTDDTPNYTATGEHVCAHGIAISQDLLKHNGGPLEFGDIVYIEGLGFKIVNDTMNKRHKNRFDVWVATYKEEKEFDQKYRNKKFIFWLVKSKIEGETNVRFGQRTKQKIREVK